MKSSIRPLPFLFACVLALSPACSPLGDAGRTRVETEGHAPGEVQAPARETSGRIELARVRMAGNGLTTALVGAARARPADGRVLVVGHGQFSVPASDEVTTLQWVMPAEHGRGSDGDAQCRIEYGPPSLSSTLPGIPVDVGGWMRFRSSSSALEVDLERLPADLNHDADGPLVWAYLRAHRLASASEPGDWLPKDELFLEIAGAAPPADDRRAALVFGTVVPETLVLPEALEGVTVQGIPLAGPWINQATGEVVREADAIPMPSPGMPLEVDWDPAGDGASLILELEVFGPGEGRCPTACTGDEHTCCSSSADCLETEVCAATREGDMACVPAIGDIHDRRGALVCELPDTGHVSIQGEDLERFQALLADDPSSVVFRLGRSKSVDVTLPDALAAGGGRLPLGPVVVHAADVVMTRLTF